MRLTFVTWHGVRVEDSLPTVTEGGWVCSPGALLVGWPIWKMFSCFCVALKLYGRGTRRGHNKRKNISQEGDFFFFSVFIYSFKLKFPELSQNSVKKVNVNKVEILWKKWMVDYPSYPQLKVKCRKQVYPPRFTHSNLETGENGSTPLYLRVRAIRLYFRRFDFLHVD